MNTNVIAKYTVRPYDDFNSWRDYNDLEEALKAKRKLQFSFISRTVVLINNNTNEEVSFKEIKNHHTNQKCVPFDWSNN